MPHIPCYGLPWMEQMEALASARAEALDIREALRLGEAGGPANLVDLGCGYGRLVPFFEGHLGAYVGIDATQDLLDAAPELDWASYYLGENAEQLSLFPPACFDAALSWFCSIGCLGAAKDAALFQAVHAALRPDGAFLLGTLNPFLATEARTHIHSLADGGIVLEIGTGLDIGTMQYPLQHFHIAHLGDGRFELKRAEHLRQQLYDIPTLKMLLLLAGFASVDLIEGAATNPRIVLLARKGTAHATVGPLEPLQEPAGGDEAPAGGGESEAPLSHSGAVGGLDLSGGTGEESGPRGS